jgi:hypothetical protein
VIIPAIGDPSSHRKSGAPAFVRCLGELRATVSSCGLRTNKERADRFGLVPPLTIHRVTVALQKLIEVEVAAGLSSQPLR